MSEAPQAPPDITRELRRAAGGDRAAFDRAFGVIYDELKGLARSRLVRERDGHTLNATALVHEAYFRLADQDRVDWQSRSHFLAAAAQAMRRILIDYAKSRNAQRHGGKAPHVPLDAAESRPGPDALTDAQALELIALDDALRRLASFDPRGSEVVQYRFFGGLSHPEIAEVLGASEMTVRRSWMMARAWLRGELGEEVGVADGGLLGGGGP